jgi:thiol:disulfide interchange protein DsbC
MKYRRLKDELMKFATHALCIVLVLTFASLTPSAFAMSGAGCGGECTSCHQLSVKEAQVLVERTGGTVRSVRQAPIKGMFELLLEKDGKKGVIFVDYARKNFMQGFIVNFETLQKVSAFDQELAPPVQTTHADPAGIPVKNAIIRGNARGGKKIYIFADPDCPFSRKMYQELAELERLVPDLAIYLMLYPLPLHPEAYDKARAMLTFRDRSTLDKGFNGAPLPAVGSEDGSRELNEILNYARRSGITATPSIVMADGRVLVGFISAQELQGLLATVK